MRAPRLLSLGLMLLLSMTASSVVAEERAPEWKVLHDEAEVDFEAGRFPEAAEKLQRALPLVEAEGNAQAVSDVHYALGAVLLEQRKLDDARRHLRASLAHEEETAGENAPTTLEALESLAIADDYAGDYAQAEGHFRSLLERWKELEGGESAAVGRATTNLALNLDYQERDAEAEKVYREALQIFEALDDPEQEAFVRTGLGNLCFRREAYRCARREYGLALRLREQALGKDHPYVATVLYNLSGVELDEGRPAKAKALLERCLKIRRVTLPEDHPFRLEAEARLAETEGLLEKRRLRKAKGKRKGKPRR